LEGEILKL